MRVARLKLPGRLLEAPGNRGPRGMIITGATRDRTRLTACSALRGVGQMIAGWASCRRRKVRAPQGRVLGNPQRGQPQGKCHRDQTAVVRPR